MGFYLGISYLKDGEKPWTEEELRNWKDAHCPNGNHLWDEVISNNNHYLFCDACEISLNISITIRNEE